MNTKKLLAAALALLMALAMVACSTSTPAATPSATTTETKPAAPADKPACACAVLKNINGGCYVNFRKAPGMKTKIIKAYPVGTAVTVLEKGDLWCKVEIDGQQGYVSTYMLKF